MSFGQNTPVDISAFRMPGALTAGGTHVTGAGTAVVFGSAALVAGVMIYPHPNNTGTVWVGGSNVGTTYATGAPLAPGASPVFAYIGSLTKLYVNATSANDVVCWFGS